MERQEGLIKTIYQQEEYIEFGLDYIADRSPNGGRFSLNPHKVKKFAGLSILSAKGDY